MRARYKHAFPQELVTHVSSILGANGTEWLDLLPLLIDELSGRWGLVVGEPFAAGEFNFVAPATRADGQLVVLKIAPPYTDDEYVGEADFLSHRRGRGIVSLLERDNELRGILLERALPGKNLAELFTGSETEAIQPAIDVLQSILGEPPLHANPTTLDRWFAGMERALGTKFPADYVHRAFKIYRRLSNQPGRTFYLHGDYHPGNVVNAERSPYLAIDPKGIVGHIGYDIAVFLNNYHWWQEKEPDIQPRLAHAVERFSAAFVIDPHELREWAFAQMVLGAWWNFDDMPEHYDNAVAKADIWNV
ncbi:MAG TPA: aminoglycoside phosphotransferase family protein [Pyrinomonadaceae bacterium]|nr:aminoglycoside phosphotransferase family protein [Pyrinomonadaceae bacterium]